MKNTSKETIHTLESLIAGLCRYPESLSVTFQPGRKAVAVILPHKADYGAIYGRGGLTLEAINIVASRMFANESQSEIQVFVEHSGIGELEERQLFVASSEFPPPLVERIALETCGAMFAGALSHEWAEITKSRSKLTVFTSDRSNRMLEAALGKLLDAIGSAHGKRIILELVNQ